MSEVNRFKIEFQPEGAFHECVYAADFDRVTAERDALQVSLDAVTFNLDKTDRVALALQARLTAADELNDVMAGLLRMAAYHVRISGTDSEIDAIDAALKPAEAAKCARCECSTVEACDERGCGFLGSGNGAP